MYIYYIVTFSSYYFVIFSLLCHIPCHADNVLHTLIFYSPISLILFLLILHHPYEIMLFIFSPITLLYLGSLESFRHVINKFGINPNSDVSFRPTSCCLNMFVPTVLVFLIYYVVFTQFAGKLSNLVLCPV